MKGQPTNHTELAWLRAELLRLTNAVPMRLRKEGSYQAAVQWKEVATDARKLAQQSNPKIERLRRAHSALVAFQ